ncbi:XdhC family protein [Terrimonas pollutisoli]|uniref:XdhC family protein n=1 Tax=Terrimonas pollutisoli TaxID=3034147 RepID=UPI0023EB079B|nr:XdhC/CoxI family protein [Terrimonas sp. H1YJ31]
MKAIATWELIEQSLEKNIPVMLLYVLESKGSSPGRQGFFMAVTDNDPSASSNMEGSIGGGIMEHKFVEMAKEKLRAVSSELRAGSIKKQYHDKTAAKNQSGMICSGEQTIFLYPVQQKDKTTIQAIISSLAQNKNGTLVLSPAGIVFTDSIPGKDFHFVMQAEDDWEYREKTGYKNKLSVIGGGHCSLAFCRLMRSLDFHIRVYDDRSALKTMLENEAAHEKHFVNSYSELSDLIESGPDHYVVIMTMGYRSDDIALKALLNKQFRFLGVLGSQSKIKKMMEEYEKDGTKKEFIQTIHAPAGLAIKSQTPEEIAISIAAQIIQIKNQDFHHIT